MTRALAILAGLLLVVVACGPGPTSGGDRAQPGDQPIPGGRLVIGSTSDVKTLQPVLSSDTASSGVWGWIYDGLLTEEKDTGALLCHLCQSFQLSPDGRTLTFILRDGLVWSDGQPFTGEDYKYTAEAVMRSKRTIRKGNLENVAGAKEYGEGKTDGISGIKISEGGKKITIEFHTVFCPAISRLSSGGPGGIIPKHHFVQGWNNKTTDTTTNIDDHALNMAPPAGMGPFVFKEYRPGDSAVLAKNPRYFKGAPLVDELIVKVYADATAIKAALMVGEVAYYGVEPKDHAEVSASPNLKGYKFGTLALDYIGWNLNNKKAPWLADKRVRQALTYGLNVDLIMEKVLLGFGTRIYSHTPPTQWAYSEEGLTKYPYDVRKAKGLIEAAGAKMGSDGVYRWTDGSPMRMKIETNQGNTVRETILQIAQEDYAKIGIKIDPLLESFPALTERTRFGKPDWEGFILGASLGQDPDPYTFWHSKEATATGLNRIGWSQTDKLIEAQRNGPDCSEAARKKVLAEFNRTLNEEQPWTFLYSRQSLLFMNSYVQNADPGAFSTIGWNVEKIWVKR